MEYIYHIVPADHQILIVDKILLKIIVFSCQGFPDR